MNNNHKGKTIKIHKIITSNDSEKIFKSQYYISAEQKEKFMKELKQIKGLHSH